MIDPKYYGDSRDEMLRALADMPCRFVVGGRLEQQKTKPTMMTTTREGEPVFVTGREHIRELPKELQKKFILLSDFRVDISSTELRRQMTESASADVCAQQGEKNQ